MDVLSSLPTGLPVRPVKLSRRRLCLAAAGAALLGPLPALAVNADRSAVVEMVDNAVIAIDSYGFPHALNVVPTIWARSDGLYVFVLGQDGTLFLHPDKAMEGRNVNASRDTNGKPFIHDIIAATIAAPGGVWTDYVWPDPGTGKLVPKHTYSRLAAGFVVAAGYSA